MSSLFAGFKIKGLRTKHKLSSLSVAKSLDITPTYLSLIESGTKNPSTKVLEKAAILFNVTLADFKESPELLNDFAEFSKKIDISNIIALLEMTLKNNLKSENTMNNKLIYSFKANGCGCKVSGRVCATDMQDATRQVQAIIKQHGYGPMNVHMNQLKNQKAAMAKWLREHEDKELNAIADSRAGQKRVSVNLEDL